MEVIYEQPEIRSARRGVCINKNMHALQQLDIPVIQLDPAILEVVLRKLDMKDTQSNNQLPTTFRTLPIWLPVPT